MLALDRNVMQESVTARHVHVHVMHVGPVHLSV